MLAVERDVKPRNMNFAKVEKRGRGRLIGRGRLLQKIRYVNSVHTVKQKKTKKKTQTCFLREVYFFSGD